ncbi:hypothetical protein [Kineococcus arenarius]|uniref:hypothetical protein n=1 Tax=Kineococcus sp. SYSU DK007 TaxID=3383128 RepID=UPI003D7D3E1B
MDRQLDAPLRPMDATAGRGLLRGVGCGAALGALTGAAMVVWDALRPAAPGVYEIPFSVLLMGYVAVIAELVGAVVGFAAAAAAASVAVLAVAEVRGRRRSWVVSVAAAVLAALVSIVVVNAFAQKADGVFLSRGQTLLLGLVSVAVALWQVRRLVRPLR